MSAHALGTTPGLPFGPPARAIRPVELDRVKCHAGVGPSPDLSAFRSRHPHLLLPEESASGTRERRGRRPEAKYRHLRDVCSRGMSYSSPRVGFRGEHLASHFSYEERATAQLSRDLRNGQTPLQKAKRDLLLFCHQCPSLRARNTASHGISLPSMFDGDMVYAWCSRSVTKLFQLGESRRSDLTHSPPSCRRSCSVRATKPLAPRDLNI
jgi:hypothetical protein